jgi:hypothetical protein
MHTYAYLQTSTSADNLKKGRPMLACDLNIRAHMLKELDKDTGQQRRHSHNFFSALLCNVQTNATIRFQNKIITDS